MTFRDARQRAAVCRALCALAGRPDVWEPLGPTDAAAHLALAPELSPGERVLIAWAWDVWTGTGRALVADAIAHLDAARLLALAELLTALATARRGDDGTKAVDEWLARYQPPTARRGRAASQPITEGAAVLTLASRRASTTTDTTSRD